MADNGQIDNIYLNFEVGGNADEKIDKIDKDLENIENNAKDATKALESFANVSKLDVLNQKLENVNESLDKAASEKKGLDDKGVLSGLTQRISLTEKLAKETARVKPISEADYKTAENAIAKVSTEVGRLEETLRVSKQRLAELASQEKENTTQFVNLASKIAKAEEKLSDLRASARLPILESLDLQIPDVSLGDEQKANLERIIATAEGGSNAFDKMGMAVQEAEANLSSFSIDRLLTDEGKLDKLQGELVETTAKLRDLLNSGGKYSSKDVDSLVNQIHRLEREIDKTKSKIQKSTIDLMDFATKPTAPMSRWQRILNSISGIFSKVGSIGSKAFEKIRKSTKKANNSSRGYQKGLRGLLGTAKRFLIFGTFFTIQRQISQAFEDGTANLYQYSKAIDGTFAQSMDRLATSFLYFKNAIGAAVAPIINAVTPALESLIDTVAEFGNKLAETFAALTGATTFKKAIKSHKEYAEAVNKTNNALAKFDEINNITTSKGDKNQDYGSMFETAEVKTKISSFGETVGKGLNNIIESINNKIKSIDFRKFASTIFTEITNFIKEINWLELGDLFSTSVVGAFNFIEGVLDWLSDTSNIDTITDGLTKFVDGIDFEKIGESFSKVFKKAIIAGIKLLFKLGEVKKKITNSLQDAISELLGGAFEGLFGDNIFSKYLKLGTKIGMIALPALMGKGFANGGYPASGEMFIARENGIPEMVGSIGGRTAVANNDQIVEAVSVGVYNAVVDAMSRSGGNKQPTIVQINGREVFRAVQDESTAYSKRTGQPAF